MCFMPGDSVVITVVPVSLIVSVICGFGGVCVLRTVHGAYHFCSQETAVKACNL